MKRMPQVLKILLMTYLFVFNKHLLHVLCSPCRTLLHSQAYLFWLPERAGRSVWIFNLPWGFILLSYLTAERVLRAVCSAASGRRRSVTNRRVLEEQHIRSLGHTVGSCALSFLAMLVSRAGGHPVSPVTLVQGTGKRWPTGESIALRNFLWVWVCIVNIAALCKE